MKTILYICLVAFSLFTLVSCNESEKEAFQNEANEACDDNIDQKLADFKSSILQNAHKVKEATLQSNYTRTDVCGKDAANNEDLKESLKPTLEKSKEVLSAYGITDKNLEEIFSDDKDVNAIILAITIAGTERQALSTRSQIANCALDALGIPAELLVGSAKSLTKKPS